MPNIKSAKKRVEVIERNKALNKAFKSELATGLKKYENAIKAEDVNQAKKLLAETFALLDENVTRGIIHKNKADRKKASFSKKLAKLTNGDKKEEVKVEAKKEVVEEKEEAPKTVEKKETAKKTTSSTKKATAKKTASTAKKETK